MQILFDCGLDPEWHWTANDALFRLHELVLGCNVFFSFFFFVFSYVCSHGSQINAVYYIEHVYCVKKVKKKKIKNKIKKKKKPGRTSMIYVIICD